MNIFINPMILVGRLGVKNFFYNLSVIIFLILFFAKPAISQADTFQFNHLGLKDGLSQASVTSIVQDDKGFMWFGTVGGLNRYDGRQMVVYRSDLIDENTLSDKHINDMCKDTEGNLWIASINGLTHMNIKTEQFTRYFENDKEQSISSNSVNNVYCDASGPVWVATGKGIDKFIDNEKGFSHFIAVNSDNNFQAVYIDESGTLWAGTFGDGLFYLDKEEGKLMHNHVPGLDDKIINAITEDQQENLWVGTNSGVKRLNKNRSHTTVFQYSSNNPNSLSDNSVNYIFQDSQSNIWIGTNNGLNLFNHSTEDFLRLKTDPRNERSLNSDRIHSLYEDIQGNLWIGSWSKGINKFSYHQKRLKHYYHSPDDKNSLSDNNIWDFVEDEDKNIWVATDFGINKFDPASNTFEHFFHDPGNKNSLSSNRIFNMELDPSGNIWMTSTNGLNKLNTRTNEVTHFFHDPHNLNSLSYDRLWGLDIDSEGIVWISTTGRGLNRFDPHTETFTHFNHDPDDPESLNADFVTDVFVDSCDQVWIGTRQGLNLYQPETNTFKKFVHTAESPHSLNNGSILDFHEDANGGLWVGTPFGANVVDIETHEIRQFYSIQDNLPDDIVWCITDDFEGNIYLGTTQGLAVLESGAESLITYDIRDGLQENEFNAGAAHTTSDGQVFVGGINGFNSFYPEDFFDNPHIPPVVITDLQLFNQSVPIVLEQNLKEDERAILSQQITYTDQLVLSHSDKVISFEFSALNYTIPEKNQYAYKLDGFDEQWNYIGNRNFVTYTQLTPGEYTFRVKASNNDGIWNEQGTSLALIITPPFWQTSWFYLLSGLLIITVIVVGYRYRVRNIREHSKKLEKEVADRTSELYNKNKDLKCALEQLEEAKDELVEKAHKAGMADIATGVLHNVGNILNSVNTSTSLIIDTISQSKLEGLIQANQILRKNINTIDKFIASNPKGKKLLKYYLKLEEPLKKEHEKILQQSKRLDNKINLINEAISAQQNYAGASMNADQASLTEMIENALALQAGSIERHGLIVEKDLQPVDPIFIQRSKLIHVLVNIFKNAKEAMGDNHPEKKKLITKTWQDEKHVYLSISDKGHGVKKENLNKIFNHGFTTKNTGHGFGLHSCANYMTEMGGKIEVFSEGEGKGATFTLIFPKITVMENR